jgi:tRNA(Ile)-lysidine synthase
MVLWTDAHAKLHRRLRATALLPPDSRVLMAVSGGQDSLCLARLLLDLQPKWGWSLAMVHCDHRWRPDSDANAQHVAQLARQWQLPCWLETAAAPPASEAAARRWRYQVLARLAAEHGYTCVVTGHTATDRAETVLYNLLRGSGREGLQALRWQRPISPALPQVLLSRPLLGFSRDATGAVCQALGLPVWEDSTNADLSWRRNRIRHELMPYLRSHFNPQIEPTLAQTAEILSAEVDYLEAQTDQLYAALVTAASDGWQIDRAGFQAVPLALQRRLVRRLLQQAMPVAPRFEHIEKLVNLAQAPHRSQTDPFPGNLVARVERSSLWLGSMKAENGREA